MMDNNVNKTQSTNKIFEIKNKTNAFFNTHEYLIEEDFNEYIQYVGLGNIWNTDKEKIWAFFTTYKKGKELVLKETLEAIHDYLTTNIPSLHSTISNTTYAHTSNETDLSRVTIINSPSSSSFIQVITDVNQYLRQFDYQTLSQLKRLGLILGIKTKCTITSNEIKQTVQKFSFFTISSEIIYNFFKLFIETSCSNSIPNSLMNTCIIEFQINKEKANNVMNSINDIITEHNNNDINNTINNDNKREAINNNLSNSIVSSGDKKDIITTLSFQLQEINTSLIILNEIIKRFESNINTKDCTHMLIELQKINLTAQKNLNSLMIIELNASKAKNKAAFTTPPSSSASALLSKEIDTTINELKTAIKSKEQDNSNKLIEAIEKIKNQLNEYKSFSLLSPLKSTNFIICNQCQFGIPSKTLTMKSLIERNNRINSAGTKQQPQLNTSNINMQSTMTIVDNSNMSKKSVPYSSFNNDISNNKNSRIDNVTNSCIDIFCNNNNNSQYFDSQTIDLLRNTNSNMTKSVLTQSNVGWSNNLTQSIISQSNNDYSGAEVLDYLNNTNNNKSNRNSNSNNNSNDEMININSNTIINSVNINQKVYFINESNQISRINDNLASFQSSKVNLTKAPFIIPNQQLNQKASYNFLFLHKKTQLASLFKHKHDDKLSYSDYIFTDDKSFKKEKGILLITPLIICLIEPIRFTIKAQYSLRNLKQITLCNQLPNLVLFNFNQAEENDLVIEAIRRLELINYIIGLYNFKNFELMKIVSLDEEEISYKKDNRLIRILSEKSRGFLAIPNYDSAIKVGFLEKYNDKLFGEVFKEKFIVLTYVGLMYFDTIDGVVKGFYPIINSKIDKVEYRTHHMHCFSIEYEKGNKILLGSRCLDYIKSWIDEIMILRKGNTNIIKKICEEFQK